VGKPRQKNSPPTLISYLTIHPPTHKPEEKREKKTNKKPLPPSHLDILPLMGPDRRINWKKKKKKKKTSMGSPFWTLMIFPGHTIKSIQSKIPKKKKNQPCII
jgi:hypothetical protein